MQAALITGKELIEFVYFDDPSPEPEQIVVDITYCGICGTDIHSFQSDGAAWPPHAVMNGRVSYQRLGIL